MYSRPVATCVLTVTSERSITANSRTRPSGSGESGDFVLGGEVVGRQYVCEAVDVACYGWTVRADFAALIELTDLRLAPKRLLRDRAALVQQTLGWSRDRMQPSLHFSLRKLVEVCSHFGLDVLLSCDVGTDFVVAAKKAD